MHDCSDLVAIFNRTFMHSEQTELIMGAQEPLYQPRGSENDLHQIICTRDYFASGLHEIAHWCVAGKERRKLVDFGYWYSPDGRTAQQQLAFERAEVKPQALEWIFSASAQFRFRASADNLQNNLGASDEFKQALFHQVKQYLQEGLPRRAAIFSEVLMRFYHSPPLMIESFHCAEL